MFQVCIFYTYLCLLFLMLRGTWYKDDNTKGKENNTNSSYSEDDFFVGNTIFYGEFIIYELKSFCPKAYAKYNWISESFPFLKVPKMLNLLIREIILTLPVSRLILIN